MSSGRVRKQSDSLPHKMGPMKATLPMSSVLRGPISSCSGQNSSGAFSALSPPLLRHVSPPEATVCGHRSPGALNYTGNLEKLHKFFSLSHMQCFIKKKFGFFFSFKKEYLKLQQNYV